MLKTITVLIITLIVAQFCLGQKTKQSKYVIKQSLPSLYVSYIKTDERIIFDDVKESFAWFRFHNNTKWKIVLKAGGGKEENDVRLFYDILDEDNKIIENKYCHVCSIIRLSSGKSILFSIPAKHFKNSDSMRISFSYEWEEMPFSSSPEKEPVHYVYFETPQFLK